jgi:citrate synthase
MRHYAVNRRTGFMAKLMGQLPLNALVRPLSAYKGEE